MTFDEMISLIIIIIIVNNNNNICCSSISFLGQASRERRQQLKASVNNTIKINDNR